MHEEAIADTIAAFARAAADAKRLGFDVVELQGTHGFLIDQFFWAGTNLRTDRYRGATIKERSRLAVEMIRQVRLAENPDRMLDWLGPLVEAGVDVLHCSQRCFWQAEFPEIDGQAGLNFAGWAKKLTGAATISVGLVGMSVDFISAMAGGGGKAAGIGELVRRLEREEFDLIAIGCALLNDPYWLTKVRSGDQSGLKDFNPAALAELF